ncbi:MAG TPA: 2-isopropylmalate synthase [Kofleriaceae bacterium]|jgi:2-isopropylmalate synthase|nr:2-isopropylmalate synthase [Kofleriaceae bacterium]
MTDHVRIFDTTLRDGEQSPGATMTASEKLEVARALARLGVDVIEAGFPAASPDDLAAVRAIAAEVGAAGAAPPIICALARAARPDIDAAWHGVRAAARPRIHTFLATSDLHLEHKLRMSRADVLARVADMVAYARSLCGDVEFSAEDAGRSDPAFLHAVLGVAIRAGATTLNIPDTVGYTTPDEFGALIGRIRAEVPGIDGVVLSVHCHDDLGLATANTLAGLVAGARQAEVTINGIGERAGNSSLEEIVMALHTRAAKLGLATGIDTTQLTAVSRLVSTATGIVVPPNKAIVGANAFAHESGIHQDGMLKHQATYEIMRPETVGAAQTRLVLGKHSGRAALAARLAELGSPLSAAALDRVFTRFKALTDRKKQVTDADIEGLVDALVSDERSTAAGDHDELALEGLQVSCGTMGMPTATVRLRRPDGSVAVEAAVGTGPVDAAYKAIDAIVARWDRGSAAARGELVEFAIHAVTEGIDALGHVTVRVREGAGRGVERGIASHGEARSRVFHGAGADTDIVVASARAYLRAINRMLAAGGHRELVPAERAS